MRTAIIITGLALLLAGCGGGEETDTNWAAEKQEYRERIDQALEDVHNQMEQVKADLAEAGEESQQELQERLKELETSAAKLETKLEEMGRATESTWSQWKEDVDHQLEEINESLTEHS